MNLESLPAVLLAVQGAMGGVDTIVNHEIIERLPHRTSARREIGWHSIREAIYGTLFAGLAWFEWRGLASLAIAALLAAEIVVTACDEFIENKTRVLPQNERVLHVLLTLNLGLIIAVLAPLLLFWWTLPTDLFPVNRGALGWFLSALAIASASWSVRDLIAWRKLARASA